MGCGVLLLRWLIYSAITTASIQCGVKIINGSVASWLAAIIVGVVVGTIATYVMHGEEPF